MHVLPLVFYLGGKCWGNETLFVLGTCIMAYFKTDKLAQWAGDFHFKILQ